MSTTAIFEPKPIKERRARFMRADDVGCTDCTDCNCKVKSVKSSKRIGLTQGLLAGSLITWSIMTYLYGLYPFFQKQAVNPFDGHFN